MSKTPSSHGMPHSRTGNVSHRLFRQAVRIAACFALLIGQAAEARADEPNTKDDQKTRDGQTERDDAKTPKNLQDAELELLEMMQNDYWRALEGVYSRRCRPIAVANSHLLRHVCEPSKEQSVKIAKRSKLAVQTGVKAMIDFLKNMRVGRVDPSQDKLPDLHKIVTDELLKIYREELPKEKVARLDEAIKRRNASRKRAALLCLVA